jgi:hypothetical protein
MDRSNYVWSADVENLVATLVVLKILEGGVSGLKHRSHCPIGNNNPLRQGCAQ